MPLYLSTPKSIPIPSLRRNLRLISNMTALEGLKVQRTGRQSHLPQAMKGPEPQRGRCDRSISVAPACSGAPTPLTRQVRSIAPSQPGSWPSTGKVRPTWSPCQPQVAPSSVYC
ncbi:hypothetical protein BJX66DRAFT_140186 [Aspergillus keveii]|uniref:Uncharacterized protein n=1 Tax=Aspergillus keveii TaxID=714993 RepID=A0ABR4GBD1_9EURO